MKIIEIGMRVSVSTSTEGKRLSGTVKNRIVWSGDYVYVIELDSGGETRSLIDDLECTLDDPKEETE